MSKKIKTSPKKNLEYVRPTAGTFTLGKFPGFEFQFRIISLDDEAWCISTFGKSPLAIITSPTAEAAHLCKMYFHFLTNESKEKFLPIASQEIDDETGEKKEVSIGGAPLFMKSIDGGSFTEIALIGDAFLQTLIASRPISEKWMNFGHSTYA